MNSKAEFFVVRRGATALPNSLIHDSGLSYAALALLTVCLSLPAGAQAGYRQLKGRGFGEQVTRNGLRELEERNLRFRFRIRRSGQLRELTIVTDTPMSVDEARAEIVARMRAGALSGGEIVECPSHPQPSPDEGNADGCQARKPVDNARALETSARRQPVDNSPAAPRPAGARSPAAHSSNEESKDSSLRSESLPPNQDPPPEEPAVDMAKRPKREPHGPSSAPRKRSELLPEVDWDLIAACVPQPMAGWLAGLSARRVTGLLRQAVDAGWRPGRVYGALNAARLPAEVANGPGLVIHRVGQIARTDPPAAPAARGLRLTGGSVSTQSGAGGAVESSAAERAATIARLRGNGRLSGPMVEGLISRLSGSDGASGRSAGADVADRQSSAVEARGCVRAPGLSPEEGRS